jgi:hypothetical protein
VENGPAGRWFKDQDFVIGEWSCPEAIFQKKANLPETLDLEAKRRKS